MSSWLEPFSQSRCPLASSYCSRSGGASGVRQLTEEGETASKGLGAIEGAIFGLLGLILAFSFSGGAYTL